ncbi:MAG: hypothetical protein JO199_00420, partial [Candidatus Eremiobacteraeota bacterium]|nr:hypothetical protein [Candidatus Eremiobacteraeota bacterium]
SYPTYPPAPCQGLQSKGFLNYPHGVARDGVGNIYVADTCENTVWMIPPSASPVPLASSFNYPQGVAVDSASPPNVYVADTNARKIWKISKSGGAYSATPIASPAYPPVAIVTDTASPANVYYATGGYGYGAQSLWELKASKSGSYKPLAIPGPWDAPVALAYNPSGELYVADNTTNEVYQFTPPNGKAAITVGSVPGPPVALAAYSSGGANYLDIATCCALWQVTIDKTEQSTFASGLSARPVAIAMDSAGDVFFTTVAPKNPSVQEIAAGSQKPVDVPSPASGYKNPHGLAVDAAGNLYVSDLSTNTVWMLAKTKSGFAAPSALPSPKGGFINPFGLAADGSNLYITDSSAHAVYKRTSAGAYSTVGSGFLAPVSVPVDGSHNVFVGDLRNHAVYQIPGGTGTPTQLGPFVQYPNGLDAACGFVYVADTLAQTVTRIDPDSGTYDLLGSGFLYPAGVAVAPQQTHYPVFVTAQLDRAAPGSQNVIVRFDQSTLKSCPKS